MTEKINRRGVITPDSFHPDVLQTTLMAEVIEDESEQEKIPMINCNNTIEEVENWLKNEGKPYAYNTLLLIDDKLMINGRLNKSEVINREGASSQKILTLASQTVYSVYADNNLQLAVHFLLKTNQDVLPVIDRATKKVSGTISSTNILRAYDKRIQDNTIRNRHISASRNLLKIISKGRQLFTKKA